MVKFNENENRRTNFALKILTILMKNHEYKIEKQGK